jgi:hypothetical protein
LCTLGAQSPINADGSIPAGGGEGIEGREEEPSELIYFKVYKSQIPVIEQAIDTASRRSSCAMVYLQVQLGRLHEAFL